MYSSIFILVVSIIRLSVFSFRFSYISLQKFFSRFHTLLIVFVGSIILLILSSNLLFTIVGWDGLGVSSYLLVIYYGSNKSYNAGILTVLSNRVGDVLLLIAIAIIVNIGSWRYAFYKETLLTDRLLLILLARGAFTKSAQIPFRAWLPAAIAAPTPVSSLVHSSTLVTAGVYLLFRHIHSLTILNRLWLITFIGVSTITLARLSALNEKDIKKIVALSTLSQLGLIILSVGFGWVFITFFHLVTHAFFKAIIFIRVGNIIHSSQLYQSMKNTGSALYSSPFNRSTLILARLSLCGAPFTAAFFSKEPIIEITSYNNCTFGIFLMIMFRLLLTILYSSRLIKIVLINFLSTQSRVHVQERDYNLNKGIFILSLPSFARGSTLLSLINSNPAAFSYSINLKIFIFISFLIFPTIFFIGFYPFLLIGSNQLYSIWRLGLFSGGMFNKLSFIYSFSVNMSNFSYKLRGVLSSRVVSHYTRPLMISSFYIYRLVIIIPLGILITIIIQ